MIYWMLMLISVVIITLLACVVYLLRKNTKSINEIKINLLQQSDNESSERFNTEKAEDWFEKGELSALNQYCESFITKSPNSVNANWYLALSHYNEGNYETAKNYFKQVIHINPLWRDGAIVYLQEINEKSESASRHILH